MTVYRQIADERARQRSMAANGRWSWTFADASDSMRLAVLVEEVGEVASAIQGDGDLRVELVQVAAVCVQWLEIIEVSENPLQLMGDA